VVAAGDKVTIECRVTDVYGGEDFCNAGFEVVGAQREYLPTFSCNTRLCQVVPPQIPRRVDTLRHTPAEAAIHNAILAVEAVGADPLLTDAVLLLSEAQEKVADFVDCYQAGS